MNACREERDQTIPIVGLNLGDPVQSGLIESLAHPGANLTGITPNLAEFGGKRLNCSRRRYKTCSCRRGMDTKSAGI